MLHNLYNRKIPLGDRFHPLFNLHLFTDFKTQIRLKWTPLSIGALVFSALLFSFPILTQAKSSKKIQEVHFTEMSLKGTVRNPDGAYLVQKRSIKFMPLVEIQKSMDEKIRTSTQYIR